MRIVISVEKERGCGYRHPGRNGVGIYFFGSGMGELCERLPFPIESTCPHCGNKQGFFRKQIDLVVEDIKEVPENAMKLAESIGEDHCRIIQVVPVTESYYLIEPKPIQ